MSSTWLAENSGLGLSSASVRTILAHLEEQGFLRQPHTSAGRVPTDSGYRLYVDWLVETRKRVKATAEVEARLRRAGTMGDLLDHVSQELSRASHHIGFAMTTTPDVRLQHVDFTTLGDRRVLVIVVATAGQISHKVVNTTEALTSTVLTQAANYINTEFGGMTIAEVRVAIVQRLLEERTLYDELVACSLQLAQDGLDDITNADTLSVQGTSSLFDALGGEETLAFGTLRALVQMIEEKHRLLDLLTRYLDADGLTIVIGSEHLSPDLHSFSLVASTFHDGERSGAVGVIGPDPYALPARDLRRRRRVASGQPRS